MTRWHAKGKTLTRLKKTNSKEKSPYCVIISVVISSSDDLGCPPRLWAGWGHVPLWTWDPAWQRTATQEGPNWHVGVGAGTSKQVEETWHTGRATSGPAGTQVWTPSEHFATDILILPKTNKSIKLFINTIRFQFWDKPSSHVNKRQRRSGEPRPPPYTPAAVQAAQGRGLAAHRWAGAAGQLGSMVHARVWSETRKAPQGVKFIPWARFLLHRDPFSKDPIVGTVL